MAEEKVYKGTTKSGFSFAVPDFRLRDYRTMDLLSDLEVDPENPDMILKIPQLANYILGKDQKKRLLKHCYDEKKDIVDMENVEKELSEIFKAINLKN